MLLTTPCCAPSMIGVCEVAGHCNLSGNGVVMGGKSPLLIKCAWRTGVTVSDPRLHAANRQAVPKERPYAGKKQSSCGHRRGQWDRESPVPALRRGRGAGGNRGRYSGEGRRAGSEGDRRQGDRRQCCPAAGGRAAGGAGNKRVRAH